MKLSRVERVLVWLIVLLGLLLVLTGCAAPPVTASIKVPVPCIEKKPERPVLVTDAELAAMNDYQLPLALRAYHLVAGAYIAELEAVTGACAVLPPASR